MNCLTIKLYIGSITANISGSICDHRSCVEDELLSDCDTKDSADDETNSNWDTSLIEDESVRIIGNNSISFDVVKHDYISEHGYFSFCLF